jgi:membrane fusion protein, multidrug efflux system
MTERGKRPNYRWAILAFSTAGLGVSIWTASVAQTPAPSPQTSQPPAVPVAVAPVQRHDVPVLAPGIGTVQALQSVLIQARVTGWLEQLGFVEGQEVKPNDLLALIDPRPYAASLAQAQAKQAADEAQLANNEVNYRRDAALAQRDFASRQQVDNDAEAVRQMQATVQGDQAAVQTAQLNVGFCRITSPIDGVVGFQLINVGNLIQSGSQGIVTVTQIDPIAVIFTLPQADLPRIQAAQQQGKPTVFAYSQNDQTLLATGSLLTPSNSIDSSTGTISLKATFPNPQRKLWPGQFVNARLQLSVDNNVPVIPTAAIQHGPNGEFVYLLKPDSTVAVQPVSLGYQDDRTAVVDKGLNGGEQVVTEGASRLEAGTHVTIRSTSNQS